MKKNDLTKIKQMDIKALKEKIQEAKEELLKLALDKNMNKLENPKLIKNKRRDMAQMLTILQQKELIRALEDKEND